MISFPLVLKTGADVQDTLNILDGDYVVEVDMTSKGGSRGTIPLTVSERSTKYTAPDKDGKPQTMSKLEAFQTFRDLINNGAVLTINPAAAKGGSTTTTTDQGTTTAATPWGMIIGAAVVGYLIGKSN